MRMQAAIPFRLEVPRSAAAFAYRDFRAPTTDGAVALANEWLCSAGPLRVVSVETLDFGVVRLWTTKDPCPEP
jgi:hypothetical protein